jgi:hypothetical protein
LWTIIQNFLWETCFFHHLKMFQPFTSVWDLRFSRRWEWWCCSSGFWHRVDSSVDANVSEKYTVSIFRVESFGETYCLHLQPWRWRQYVSPERWHLPTSLHGVRTQKNSIIIYLCSLIFYQ